MMKLPIDALLPEALEKLQEQTRAVLIAEPGAGKTTRVPLALLHETWLAGRKIIMLEPRRLAAIASARYMAHALGEKVGETVGYRVRLDTKVSAATRIEVITEGVLTRMLQADPALEDVGIVIFDEFHERSLQADLGLALCLETQAVLREDLRLLVMSATLDAAAVSKLLDEAPVLVSKGRSYPVKTVYVPRDREERIEKAAARAIEMAYYQEEGDLLVFLPGAGEIGRVQQLLAVNPLPGARIAPLYGNLPQEAQEMALKSAKPGERKIVLSTPIAETSLTVDGVRIVIDSGLQRAPRFSPRTGMTRLETVRISLASADQRRGRAGRQAPGVCYRLWSEVEERLMPPHRTPEILETDLGSLALELAAWGVTDPASLAWLDAPPSAAYGQACELLGQLGALDPAGNITPHGRRMSELGVEPRLAHMVLRAVPLGFGEAACELAALLQERDLFRSGKERGQAAGSDLRLRFEAFHAFAEGGTGENEYGADAAAKRRVIGEARQWKRKLGLNEGSGAAQESHIGLLLAFAYPDRIAQNRGDGRFLLSGGRGAAFARQEPLAFEPYLVAAVLDDIGADSRILLAAPLGLDDLLRHFGDRIRREESAAWDPQARNVRARKREWLGALLLKETVWANPDPESLLSALLDGVRQEGLGLLHWTKAANQLRERISFMHRHADGWPDVSDAALLENLEDWLAPHLYGMKRLEDLQRLQPASLLEGMLGWTERQELDAQAPTHWTVPSGSRIPIDYSNPDAPVLAVRLQEMFGLKETPRLAYGRVPLVLHLLSPAHRPVQVTSDLASFWREAYFEVKKDLKGRYPKHVWPDDPLSAVPTNRAKPRS